MAAHQTESRWVAQKRWRGRRETMPVHPRLFEVRRRPAPSRVHCKKSWIKLLGQTYVKFILGKIWPTNKQDASARVFRPRTVSQFPFYSSGVSEGT